MNVNDADRIKFCAKVFKAFNVDFMILADQNCLSGRGIVAM